MDGEIFVLPSGALRFLRARTTTLAASHVGMRAIPDVQTDVVEMLTRGAAIAVAFWEDEDKETRIVFSLSGRTSCCFLAAWFDAFQLLFAVREEVNRKERQHQQCEDHRQEREVAQAS